MIKCPELNKVVNTINPSESYDAMYSGIFVEKQPYFWGSYPLNSVPIL